MRLVGAELSLSPLASCVLRGAGGPLAQTNNLPGPARDDLTVGFTDFPGFDTVGGFEGETQDDNEFA